MQYFFILGSNPTLSIAEFSAFFNPREDAKSPLGLLASDSAFIIDFKQPIDAKQIIKKLGGTIKIGIVNQRSEIRNYDEIKKSIMEMLKEEQPQGKFNFGVSYYGTAKFNIKSLAMEVKKTLRERGVSSRWVTSREAILSSVVVEQNKLTQPNKGVEIILIEAQGKLLIGRTQAVQPFKELSFRDYGRPARDDRSGMLPPKLAQIMINLAPPFFARPIYMSRQVRGNRGDDVGVGQLRKLSNTLIDHDITLLDPFCGSGTILTEAMLMGIKNIIGSDISQKAIDDTKKNIEWMKKNYELRIKNCELYNINAVELSKHIKPNSIDIIATEPYLGPQRGMYDIKKIINELENLYSKALAEFKKILKKDGCVVMAWPIFVKHGISDIKQITPCLNDFDIINPLPEFLRGDKRIKLTNRNTIIYGREGQRVWREIVVLQAFRY